MEGRRTHLAGKAWATALVLLLVLTVGTGGAAAAKKKAKAKPFQQTVVVNVPIPEDPGAAPSVAVLSQIAVPKKYKGKRVGDVNVTGIQTTGSGAGAAEQLSASLRAPNGRTVLLFRDKGDQSLGPWTLDDDTDVSICDANLPTLCPNPNQSLNRPFAGTSNLAYNDNPALTPLQAFDGVAMKGTWTFAIVDTDPAGGLTSTLNGWGIKITPAKRVKG